MLGVRKCSTLSDFQKKRAYGLSSGPLRSVSLEFWGTRCAIYTLFTALGLCWGQPPQILPKRKPSIWNSAAETRSRAAGQSQGNRAHAFRMTLVAQGKLPQIRHGESDGCTRFIAMWHGGGFCCTRFTAIPHRGGHDCTRLATVRHV